MRERRVEYWWIEWAEGMPLEPARIEYRDGRPPQITEIGSDYAQDLAERGVRLVERVQPPRTRDADLPAVGSFHG